MLSYLSARSLPCGPARIIRGRPPGPARAQCFALQASPTQDAFAHHSAHRTMVARRIAARDRSSDGDSRGDLQRCGVERNIDAVDTRKDRRCRWRLAQSSMREEHRSLKYVLMKLAGWTSLPSPANRHSSLATNFSNRQARTWYHSWPHAHPRSARAAALFCSAKGAFGSK